MTDALAPARPTEPVVGPTGIPPAGGARDRGPRAGRTGLLLGGLCLLPAAVATVGAGWIAPDGPFATAGPALQSPSASFPMGTDDLGHDLLALVVHGTRTSVVVALGVITLAGLLAVVVGMVAGFAGGAVDDALSRLIELVQVLPRFFLAVVVVAVLGTDLVNLVLLLGLTSWCWTARVVRSETLTLRERDFVTASRALGASTPRILRRHILPSLAGPTVVLLSVVASSAILTEAGLGFVGLSDPDVASLGSLASAAQPFLRSAWWMAFFPGAAIVGVVVGVNLVGDALGDLTSRRGL